MNLCVYKRYDDDFEMEYYDDVEKLVICPNQLYCFYQ